ncbi:MAG: hypothetical protein ACXVB3_05475 [Flavisolibacter sp.]
MSAFHHSTFLKNWWTCCSVRYLRLLALLFFLHLSLVSIAQEDQDYDEVSVMLTIPRLGSTEISALIKNEEVRLDVKALFDYLKIKNTLSPNLDSLSGYIMDPQAYFLIDKVHNRIQFRRKDFDMSSHEGIQTKNGIYLNLALLSSVFGLDCQFNFRSLSVSLKTNMELPALREIKQEQMRRNISQLQGVRKADTSLKRVFSLFHFGVADWSFTSMQEIHQSTYLNANLLLGATVAGGEASCRINYNSERPSHPLSQIYRWRFVNNDLPFLKQVIIGQVATPSISSIFSTINGFQLTNTPTAYRKSFGTYRYSGKTEPQWIVELYVNNILMTYVKANDAGFYTFDIPLIYGNSAIKLRFYGPWGEEQTKEENISIPFNFLPKDQFEYTLSAGIVQDEKKSRFTRAGFNYGLSRRITLGGGSEYLSTVMAGKPMPYFNTSIRLASGLIINNDWTKGVTIKTSLNYRHPSNVEVDLSLIKYQKGQTAILNNYLEERKATLSVPLHLNVFNVFSRFVYHEVLMPGFHYRDADFLFSTVLSGMGANFRTYAQYNDGSPTTVFSNLSLSFRIPGSFRLAPQLQYEYDQKSFSSFKLDMEKRMDGGGYLTGSYEKNCKLGVSSFTLGFRLDLSFARTFFTLRNGSKSLATTQAASGSLLFDRAASYHDFDDQSREGKGGFIVVPFLDLNGNGSQDPFEPRVSGLRLKVNGARVEEKEDSSLIISGMEAYSSCFIELDKNSFDDISWKIKNTTIRATVEPNLFKIIKVPVLVQGEASGMVYLQEVKTRTGLSRMQVYFFDSSNKKVAGTLTESDGYFSFLGLAPGRYKASIDTAQLRLLDLAASPQSLFFTIAEDKEGTVADGFEFFLRPLHPKDTTIKGQEPKDGISEKPNRKLPNKYPRDEKDYNIPEPGKITEQKASLLPRLFAVPKRYPISVSKERSDPSISTFSPGSSHIMFHHKKEKVTRDDDRKRPTSKTRFFIQQDLVKEQHRLNHKQKDAFLKIIQLLDEQKKLIQKQKELIEEIRILKLRLLNK